MHDFEELDDIDEDYNKLIAAITIIREESEPHLLQNRGKNTATAREEEESEEDYPYSPGNDSAKQERVGKDHEGFTRRRLVAAVESHTSIKLTARSIAQYRNVIPCLTDSEGRKVTSRFGMEAAIKEYYERLFRSIMPKAPGRMLTPHLENNLSFTPSKSRCLVANAVEKTDSWRKT
ncbi:hypothetical protein ANCDUO_00803 [Ancylostoma duodenale]|uniref:Uncharacterized protein n=1 Tax=Ancylostoma duodenale TaxID=51022 RepID=A0A0C2H4Y3_9BILA|nr:hypothetical protein ANCDUO_00803 [Ancylostoma duodenale]